MSIERWIRIDAYTYIHSISESVGLVLTPKLLKNEEEQFRYVIRIESCIDE